MNYSYITDKGCLVFNYDPVKDDYESAEKEALIKHGIEDGAKLTTIGVTPRTDFLSQKKDQTLTFKWGQKNELDESKTNQRIRRAYSNGQRPA